MWEAYRERRAWLIPAINSIDGLCCAHPDGAFYIFPEVRSFFGKGSVYDSQSLATYLLDEAGVAVIPGSAFGSDDHVRISYAVTMDRLQEGVRRIESALKKLR
jgi:aspartate aminotransferase